MEAGNDWQGITSAQLLAFLDGSFTAMPEMNGWYFKYTTVNITDPIDDDTETRPISDVKTWALPEITSEAGERIQIPLEDGEYFASLQLCYDGDADLSHENNTVDGGVIWYMKDIGYHRMSVNPYNDAAIRIKDYVYSSINLRSKVEAQHIRRPVVQDPVTHLGCKIKASPSGCIFYPVYSPEALYIVSKTTGMDIVEYSLSDMSERSMPKIMTESDSLSQILVEPHRPRHSPRYL